MNKQLFQLWHYLQYRLRAKGRHGIHSPFVYDFIEQVLNDKRHFYAFDQIELLRKKLLKDNREIELTDFGAGSGNKITRKVSLKHLASTVSMPPKYGRLLFKLVNYFQPENILELGTCIGMSSMYMNLAKKEAALITLEGNEASAAIAQRNFEAVELNKISIHTGNFADTLSGALVSLKQLDFAFIDGNHRYEPTKEYFEKLLPLATEKSCFIFHDIHWSPEMYRAWQYIMQHEQVSVTIDVFFMGIVFFKKNTAKQNFVLKY